MARKDPIMIVILNITEDQAVISLSEEGEVFDWREYQFEEPTSVIQTPGFAYNEAADLAEFLGVELAVEGLPLIMAWEKDAEVTVGILASGGPPGMMTLAHAVTFHRDTARVVHLPRQISIPEGETILLPSSDVAALEWAACLAVDVKTHLETVRSVEASLLRQERALRVAMVLEHRDKTNKTNMPRPEEG